MERFDPSLASPEELQRFGYLEGRPELFETKLFGIEFTGRARESVDDESSLLVLGRDPGGMNSLLPVLDQMRDTQGRIAALVDGRAEEALQERFALTDLTPTRSIFEASDVIKSPKVILAGVSTSSGIERYVAATFPEIPIVLVEDYYRASFEYLRAAQEGRVAAPTQLCVMDAAAGDLIAKEFPEYADRIVVTGQPAFDRFASEPTAEIAKRTRGSLGIPDDLPLISFMSALQDAEEIPLLARALKNIDRSVAVAVRKHPRDNRSWEDYGRMIGSEGIRAVDTRSFTTDEISAASDIVMTSWSTEGIHALYRRKPSIHYIDRSLPNIPPNVKIPVPPVRLGASLGATTAEELPALIMGSLDPDSDLRKTLQHNMERWYAADGKNAERVASIVKRHL